MLINDILVFLLVTIIIIGFSAFNKFKPTCKRFIFNTYAYVTFMILMIFITHEVILNTKELYINLQSTAISVICFIIALVVLVFLLSISPTRVILKHSLLIIWLLVFGCLTFPITEKAMAMDKDVLNQIIIIFITIVVTASGIVFLKPNIIHTSYIFPLILGLVTLIISQIFAVIFSHSKKLNMFITITSIILFTIFISYDTKVAYTASTKCVEGTANYINYALSLFLDFINLFSALER